jgi:hypothetical protein
LGKFYEELGGELSLYVRQLAWLGTAPKPRSTKQTKPDTDAEPLTRLQRMTIDDMAPDFPPIRTPWVIDWLMEVGPTDPGAMSAVPITWSSIEHWQHCMGHDLPPWVAKLLRRLSVEFVAETVRAREPDCPPPWTATSSLNRDEVSRKVTNAFRAMMLSKGE